MWCKPGYAPFPVVDKSKQQFAGTLIIGTLEWFFDNSLLPVLGGRLPGKTATMIRNSRAAEPTPF
jgi:hypothetical protein